MPANGRSKVTGLCRGRTEMRPYNFEEAAIPPTRKAMTGPITKMIKITKMAAPI